MSRARWMAPAVIAVVAVACAWWWHALQVWSAVHTGSLNSPGTPPNYNFYSGFGSIILPPLLNGLVLALVFWWHNQCGVTGCYWYARRKTAADERACFLHHPHKKRTVRDIHAAHHAATKERGGSG